ncbi:MAG: redoxin domain-containing protein [Actinomycetota bacterium]|nr:redoxin domain-containing protein [Actinomycetota bacterium]
MRHVLEPIDSPDQHVVGQRWPDIALPDHSGVQRTLTEVCGRDPFLLHTWRGVFCPKEQTFFRRVLLPLQEEVDVAYTRIVSLSTEPPEVASAVRAGLDARWTFLCDVDRTVLTETGLIETTDTVHNPYAPYSYLLMPDLTVAAAWNGYWYWGRPTAEDIRQAFRDAIRALHADTWRVPREDD